jgi:methylmalonyl-CoA mutase C-terminal domain/subunit
MSEEMTNISTKIPDKGKRIRVLIAKPGLDGHDRGAKVVALSLRDAGMEVLYTGLHKSVDEIVNTATQEDVNVIGVSVLSGAHVRIAIKLMTKLKDEKITDILVLFGGNIPKKDISRLKELGVSQVFPTGSKFDDIINFIKDYVK